MQGLHDPEAAPPIIEWGRPSIGVVLAAGRAERLSRVTRGRSKVLLRLAGVSLLERAVRNLLTSGLKRVVVVAGFDARSVEGAVERMGDPRVELVTAQGWEAGNGASLSGAACALDGQGSFVLLCSDHLFSAGALDGLLEAGGPAVLVDESPTSPAWEEGTRVRIRRGMAVAFRKSLPEPVIDCGRSC